MQRRQLLQRRVGEAHRLVGLPVDLLHVDQERIRQRLLRVRLGGRRQRMDRTRRRKAQGLHDPYLFEYTFAHDNGQNLIMEKAYVDHWPEVFKKNIGLLLFGDVGTGKSFLAGRIANALLDQGVPVLMTNFPTILARLCGTFGEDRTDFLDSLGDYDLLIIDDLGAERNTEYALEQMFSIIDSRYRCNKPLIVTTNLKLDELKHPPDLAHARIYDRILERCAPILFAGKNFREDNAASTKAAARQIITSTAASHRQTATEKGEL